MPTLTNPRWELFARGRAEGKTITESAQDAGYSPRSAYNQGSRLMRNDEVQARIAELQTDVTDRVVEKTALTESHIITQLMQTAELCSNTSSKFHNPAAALRALELLGKTLGMFTNRKEERRQPREFKSIDEMNAESKKLQIEIAELEERRRELIKRKSRTVH